MEGVLNAAEFSNPRRHDRWLNQAMGWRTTSGAHEGGLRDPREIKLHRGACLFRIGHSRGNRGAVPDEVNLSSAGWMEDEAFMDIGISADTIGIPRQNMARLKLSVSERFGVFDLIFWVRLLAPLGAFTGFGYPVFEKPDSGHPDVPPAWAWPGREVRQCFIPGLRDLHNRPTELPAEAFQLIVRQPVHAWGKLDSGAPKPPG